MMRHASVFCFAFVAALTHAQPAHAEHFSGHPYAVFEWLPVNAWRYQSNFGPDNDLGMGASAMVGYMGCFGLGVELRAGARHHASRDVDIGTGQFFNYKETEVPLLAGLRYNAANLWDGGLVQPFVAGHAGAGGYFYADATGFSTSEWNFMFDLGVGLDVYVTRHVALGLSYWFDYYAYYGQLSMHSLGVQLTL